VSLFRSAPSPLRRRAVGLLEGRRRRVLALRPLCDLCGKYLDGEELVESWPTGARVLGRHHGAEELASFELGTRGWDERDLSSAMRAHRWFQPETRAETEMPPNNEPALSSEALVMPSRRS